MRNEIKKIVKDILGCEDDVVVDRPKDSSFGHFATPIAFSLAKIERKSPMVIAQEIALKLSSCETFSKVEAVGGYVNMTLHPSYLDKRGTQALVDGENFAKPLHLENKEKVLLEFVSANPTGPLHIGHARGAVYGDALLQLGRYLGHTIDSEYYINDAGRQIYLLGLSLYLKGREDILGDGVVWPEEFYRGEYITELAQKACDDLGKEVFASEENIGTLSSWGKDQMIELIKQNLGDAKIVFDAFISEKELFGRWEATQEKLKKHDALYVDDEGKTWLRSTDHGDAKDRVVVRENGEPTYLAGDIIYHNDKFERGYDRYINIWGADHHGYIPRVKSAVNFLGYDANNLEVLLSQMVALLKGGEPYKMSKRAGNFILMSEVVEEIGADALRFIFLSKKSDTHLEFDVDDLKVEDSSNPVFYVNYAHARVNSVLEKSGRKKEEIVSSTLEGLDDDGFELLFFALSLNEVLVEAYKTREIHRIPEYIVRLATRLHRYYTEHRVIGSEHEKAYLKLFLVVALSIRTGLKIVGITAKERM